MNKGEIYRHTDETEETLFHKVELDRNRSKKTADQLFQKGFLKKDRRGKLSVSVTAVRRKDLSLAERKVLYSLLGLEMITDAHPLIVRAEGILGGKPYIVGTRISIETIATLYEAGEGMNTILTAYPHLTRYEVDAALRFYFSWESRALDKAISR